MTSFHEQFLRQKYFGQPYMPTDFPQLVYLLRLQSRRLIVQSTNYIHEYYLAAERAPWGYLALVRDLIVAFLIFTYLRSLWLTLIGYGPINCARMVGRTLTKKASSIVMKLPSIQKKIDSELQKTVVLIEKELVKNDEALLQFPELPATGLHSDVILSEMDHLQDLLAHSDWENGKVSGAVYHGGMDLLQLQLKAYERYSVANQLHPDVFPGIRKMEAEVVSMVLKLFNAPASGCGSTTSGGTESLLLAGLAAREYGKKKGIVSPEVIAPITVHAGIEKACFYFGMKLHKVDVDPKTYKVDVKRVRLLINSNTVLLVGSAPNYPHGIIDDIEQLSKLGQRYNIPVHVDACLGSFIVAFLERANVHKNRDVPLFDFRLEGVTSISCDTHKYGFAPKGSSIIMYRSPKLRECQYYVLSDWTGGMYGSPTLAGSRPGALMAGCWATLVHIGVSGYTQSCFDIVTATMKVKRAIETDDLLSKNLEILGDPIGSVIAFKAKASSKVNIYSLGDAMNKRGWHLATLQNPAALHFALTRLTVPVVNELIGDLIDTVHEQQGLDETPQSDTAAVYGVAGSVSTAGVADRIIVAFLDTLYKL